MSEDVGGILLVDKPKNKTSFSLISSLRRLLNIQKIGHAGTLDPFATGVMVLLIGKKYTRMSDQLLTTDKEYIATALLGIETDSYDCDGQVTAQSDFIPSLEALKVALESFQGEVLQTPPMFSAKKKNGKKLYELARKGITIERTAVPVTLQTELLKYEYPYIQLRISCSKGTYIRSIAHDLGCLLGCGAHLSALRRTRSGNFHIDNCIDGSILNDPECNVIDLQRRFIRTNDKSRHGSKIIQNR